MSLLEKYTDKFIDDNYPEKKGLLSFIGKKKRQEKKEAMKVLLSDNFKNVAAFYHEIAVASCKNILIEKCKNEKGRHVKQIGKATIQRTTVKFKP